MTLEEGCLARALGLSHAQALSAWGAVRSVAAADGYVPERSRRLLDVAATALGVTHAIEASGATDAPGGELERLFTTSPGRRGLVDALVVPACIEGEVTVARERMVSAFAQRLGVRSPWPDLLPAMRRGRVFAVKRALALRSPDARRLFRRIWEEEGVLGLARAGVFVAGLHRDEALAARFHALSELPAGSFGRAVADHFAARGLAFPGEKGGMPERMIHHDLLHVLNGYDTDPAGECELGAFYAAFADGEPFTFVMTVLATFHLGLRVSPAVVTPARGAFDPERAVRAFVRGRGVRADVMGAWDYWSLMPLPLEEARAQLGIGDGRSAAA